LFLKFNEFKDPTYVQTLILNKQEVESVVNMEDAIDAMEKVFSEYALGLCTMPEKTYIQLPQYNGDFRAMPAFIEGSVGVKWINAYPENPKRFQLPTVTGIYILSDPETGQPRAIMDATRLTALRTAAAAGVASKHLKKGTTRSIGIIGCGVQAESMVEAHKSLYSDDLMFKFSDLNVERSDALASKYKGISVTLEEAANSDILCTCTPAVNPVVEREWISNGTHINAIGADAKGKSELKHKLLMDSKIIVDDYVQAKHYGEIALLHIKR
jgi:alanine dehydrogenase